MRLYVSYILTPPTHTPLQCIYPGPTHCPSLSPPQGEVLINGFQLDYIREEFRSNTGYLMQLTAPYYEELTVRENLTLAAQLRLPGNMTARDRFDRVEKVMYEVSGSSRAYALVILEL